jgi:hypothetical protein
MEFLGYCNEAPVLNGKGRWDYLEIECPDDYVFNDTTSKIMKTVKENACKAIVADPDNIRYFVDVLDVRYDGQEKIIKIWPHSCGVVKK